MKIRLQIKLSKPRNPVCVAAKQRKAGVHQPEHPHRHNRRAAKTRLRQMVILDEVWLDET